RERGRRRGSLDAVTGQPQHRDVAQRRRVRGKLARHAAQLTVLGLADDPDLHRTFASSRSSVASSAACAFVSPSLKIFPPPRAGGGSSFTISSFTGSSTSATGRSGISFFFAFMIPGSDG